MMWHSSRRKLVSLYCIFMLYFPGVSHLLADSLELNLSEAHAQYTIEITKHVNWPNDDEITSFVIAILGGEQRLFEAFEQSQNLTVRGKGFEIVEFDQADFDAGKYTTVFIGSRGRFKNSQLFESSQNVLLIVEGRVSSQVQMFNLITENNRLKLEINRTNLAQRGFSVSTSLLEFAGSRQDLGEELRERESKLNVLLSQVSKKEEDLSKLIKKLESNQKLLLKAQTQLQQNELIIKQKQNDLEALKTQIEESLSEVELSENALKEKRVELERMQKQVEAKEANIAKLQQNIEQNKAFLATQIEKIKEQQNVIENREQTIDEQRNWMAGILVVSIIFSLMIYGLLRSNNLRNRANLELKAANEKLYQLATTDDLTGLYSRRYFFELAQKEFLRSQRNHFSAVFLMIDIDHFKSVNDTYGHPMGDEVIRRVANILQESLRKYDIAGRLGGEEFAMMLMDCDSEQAMEIAHRISDKVESEKVAYHGASVGVTISVGLSQLKCEDTQVEQVIMRADKALYQAKKGGRNRVADFSCQHMQV
ncbi:YfiR/HmsC family protein [Aliikangiella sp. G2MR2-5]|uniref:YfiR/HmsC family protein n=1 Tax=Aliikangiella sp. G2MR2-5 TaxID=2788943 RepID=UPI0018A9D202|nr:YfiR/HmsC family protein [Aliikangiella sp. G2MR2-5]